MREVSFWPSLVLQEWHILERSVILAVSGTTRMTYLASLFTSQIFLFCSFPKFFDGSVHWDRLMRSNIFLIRVDLPLMCICPRGQEPTVCILISQISQTNVTVKIQLWDMTKVKDLLPEFTDSECKKKKILSILLEHLYDDNSWDKLEWFIYVSQVGTIKTVQPYRSAYTSVMKPTKKLTNFRYSVFSFPKVIPRIGGVPVGQVSGEVTISNNYYCRVTEGKEDTHSSQECMLWHINGYFIDCIAHIFVISLALWGNWQQLPQKETSVQLIIPSQDHMRNRFGIRLSDLSNLIYVLILPLAAVSFCPTASQPSISIVDLIP